MFKTSSLYSGITETEEIPTKYNIFNNYPNPFNPTTKIKFEIPNKEFVTLIIYNTLGEEIIRLVQQDMFAGSYEVIFDGSCNPSGVYFYKFSAGKLSRTKTMVLIK